MTRASCKRSGSGNAFFPKGTGRNSRTALRNPSMIRSVGNDRLYRDAAVARDDIQRTAQRQYSLAHTDQAEAGLVIRRQTATVVADAHHGATAISMRSCSLF